MDVEPPRISEQLLIERLDELQPTGDSRVVLCRTLGRAQLARAWAACQPEFTVACNFWDVYSYGRAAELLADGPTNVRLTCLPDPVDEALAAAALPLSAQGDAEWTRELLQTVQRQLTIGGALWAATDHPQDRWLRHELERLFDRVSGWKCANGVVYRATRDSTPTPQPMSTTRSPGCTSRDSMSARAPVSISRWPNTPGRLVTAKSRSRSRKTYFAEWSLNFFSG